MKSCEAEIAADMRGTKRAVAVHVFFFFQAEDGIRDVAVTGVQTCALPIFRPEGAANDLVARSPAENQPSSELKPGAVATMSETVVVQTETASAQTQMQPSPPSAQKSAAPSPLRSEEHTSELQSRLHLVCRLLLEKKNHLL